MPKMIVLNGPPGSGKSTLAQMYVDEHPLALNLDIDRIRSLLGQWRADPGSAGLLARAIALEAASTHLRSGHDVVIPQFLGRATFIEQAERVAGAARATFHEIALLDTRDNTLLRFTERSRRAADPAHVQAQEMLDESGGLPLLAVMYDQVLAIVASRPETRVVNTRTGQVNQAYQDFLCRLG